MSGNIVQLVPRLPPSIGGVADYASLLARRWRADFGIESSFLVGDASWQGASWHDAFAVERIARPQARELEQRLTKLGADLVLLHYAGYGYQKRGCPVWLVHGLSSWKSHYPQRRLVVMFHELFATGRPWQSSFWASPLQKFLAQALARMADHCLTNLTRSAQALTAMTGRSLSSFTVLPVFSNAGQSPAPKPWHERQARMIVFGSAASRRQVYLEYGDDLARACRALDVDTVVDIGPPCGEIAKFPFTCLVEGILSAETIAHQLTDARAGFFTCPVPYLGKSSIFAAYAAHGLLPVTFAANHAANQDGLIAGQHFWPVEQLAGDNGEKFSAIAERAHDWYFGHGIASQARFYAACLRQPFSASESATDWMPALPPAQTDKLLPQA
jgi:hypothetical protein